MSKALRVVTQEMRDLPPLPTTWHPFYVALTGEDIPCYVEFSKLTACLQTTASDCQPEVRALSMCLKRHGVDLPAR